jgi:hypothetical protein
MEITKRLRILFLLTAVSLFGTHHTLVATYAVGTCEPKHIVRVAVSQPHSGRTIQVAEKRAVHRAIFPASIPRMCAEKHTWQPDKAALPPPSFRRFSTTAASCGTAGPERWRGWEWLVPTLCKRRPRKARMPTPLASEHSQPTRISSRCGKTPTPTSPS